MSFSTILTAVGRAKIAAATSGGPPVSLVESAVGDGSGNSTTPSDTQVELVNEVYRALVSSLSVNPDFPDQLVVELIVPASVGGFTIREVGVFDADGDLFAVGNLPDTVKPSPASGSVRDLTIFTHLAISNEEAQSIFIPESEAYVTLSTLEGYATRDWARGNSDFFAVISASQTAPPAGPALGDQYLIPAGATGAWAANAGKVAHWRGATLGWQFIAPRIGAHVSAASSGATFVKSATGWAEVADAPGSALYLHANCL